MHNICLYQFNQLLLAVSVTNSLRVDGFKSLFLCNCLFTVKLCKFFVPSFLPMAHPRVSKCPATGNHLSSLSSEVLRLRLQALNLSVRGTWPTIDNSPQIGSQKPNYSCWPCHARLSREVNSSQGTLERCFCNSPAYGSKQRA